MPSPGVTEKRIVALSPDGTTVTVGTSRAAPFQSPRSLVADKHATFTIRNLYLTSERLFPHGCTHFLQTVYAPSSVGACICRQKPKDFSCAAP